MFCSICGADSQKTNAYCKRCGEWLPDIKSRSRLAFGGETPQQNVLNSLLMNALGAIAALFAAVALYASHLGHENVKWSVYLAAALCLSIAGWQASSFVIGLKLRRRFRRSSVSVTDVAQSGRTTTPSLETPQPPSLAAVGPSITEDTTELLEGALRIDDSRR